MLLIFGLLAIAMPFAANVIASQRGLSVMDRKSPCRWGEPSWLSSDTDSHQESGGDGPASTQRSTPCRPSCGSAASSCWELQLLSGGATGDGAEVPLQSAREPAASLIQRE